MPKILCVRERGDDLRAYGFEIDDASELIEVDNPLDALSLLSHEAFDRVVFVSSTFKDRNQLGRLLESQKILAGMPDGVVLLDSSHNILWANEVFQSWTDCHDVVDMSFYTALGKPEILGPDFCPFHTAMATGHAASSSLRVGDNCYFQLHVAPLSQGDEIPEYLVVSIQDTTEATLQQQKLEAIHKAGTKLADLVPEEIFCMEVEERIELLKSNILHFTKDLLNFDVIEVRLLDQTSDRLEVLLSEGIDAQASARPLFAEASGNGVTGFVAQTGKSYLCEDTTEDPLYIDGLPGAKSSLTVPLIWHDQVIGTINVESPETGAFTESDLQFLEIFSRDLAAALNTLELLVAQRTNAAQESVEAIHSAVALPIDQILNDAAAVMENYIGHDPNVVQHLRSILRKARDIKQVIHRVGETMAPAEAVPAGVQVDQRPILKGRRILVVDDDESVRNDAHMLLERFGCFVETAADGCQALSLGRSAVAHESYDAIIADIRLPDMSGFEFLVKLKEFMEAPPLVLMTGFGYDPGHSIVKARQAGLPPNATLYKPFRLDQLLETVERTITMMDEPSVPDCSSHSG